MEDTSASTARNTSRTQAACPRPSQPLQVINVPGALLRMETLAALSGLAPSTIRRDAAAGKLQVTRLSTRCTRITSEHARAYLAALTKERS